MQNECDFATLLGKQAGSDKMWNNSIFGIECNCAKWKSESMFF